jgi:hypothetical protein
MTIPAIEPEDEGVTMAELPNGDFMVKPSGLVLPRSLVLKVKRATKARKGRMADEVLREMGL